MPLRPAVTADDHSHGDPDARLTIVKYGDYQCPHCARAHHIVKQLQQDLGRDLRFVFRNFPLQKIHADAMHAALAAEAAALQNSFWEMHDLIFDNQHDLSTGALHAFAEQLGLDMERFSRDMDRPELVEKVELDFEEGIRSGVNATPTFYINGDKYNNGWESDRMYRYILEHYPAHTS